MRIINHTVNTFFLNQAAEPCRGFITGPAKATCAIAQIGINLIGLIFAPLTYPCRSKNSDWSATKTIQHIGEGFKHLLSSIFIDSLPGTSFLLPTSTERKLMKYLSNEISERNTANYNYSCDENKVRYSYILGWLRSWYKDMNINYRNENFSWSPKL